MWQDQTYCFNYLIAQKLKPEYLRIKQGQKFPISLKVPPIPPPHPEPANLHREKIPHQIFDTVTHLEDKSQILTLFEAACASNRGPKG